MNQNKMIAQPMNRRYLLLLLKLSFIFAAFIIYGCEAPESHKQQRQPANTKPEISEKKIQTLTFKGMFSDSVRAGITECSTGKFLPVSKASDLSAIDEARSSAAYKKRMYVEAEGFISYEENPALKKMDTVLVIGRMIRLDMQFDCLPK